MKALIVDDEPLARHSIRLLLERDGEVEIAGECSGADAAALIARTRPDILFLDIQMPEVGGFELLEEIGLGAVPVVIFVTAYDHYAIQAFDAHGLDYLLKPFDDDRFLHALERAKTQLRTRGSATFAQRFLVRVRDRFVVVNTSEIDWIEAADYYVTLHAGGKSHLLRETMAAIETRLDPAHFVRVHRSAIVNIDRVREIHPMFRGDCTLVLADGTQVKLSRARREEFERIFSR